MSVHKNVKKVTTHTLQEMKNSGEKISMLTGYDFSIAKIILMCARLSQPSTSSAVDYSEIIVLEKVTSDIILFNSDNIVFLLIVYYNLSFLKIY